MKFEIHHYFHCDVLNVDERLDQILSLGEAIMASQEELTAQVTAATEKLAKIGTETSSLLTKVAELQAALEAAGQVTPELEAAVAALAAQAQVVDDLVPDA